MIHTYILNEHSCTVMKYFETLEINYPNIFFLPGYFPAVVNKRTQQDIYIEYSDRYFFLFTLNYLFITDISSSYSVQGILITTYW
jgi:hypothetical protein